MSSTISFWAPKRNLVFVQRLVKRFGGYFEGNPIDVGEKSRVSISFDEIGGCNAFNRHLSIVLQPWF